MSRVGTPLVGWPAFKRDLLTVGVHGGSRDDRGRFGMLVLEAIAHMPRAHLYANRSRLAWPRVVEVR